MKYILPLFFVTGLFLLCSCAIFDPKHSAPAPVILAIEPPALAIGENWQIIEEAPKLSDERGHLPFQMEQSIQPGVAKPISPAENRKIETLH